VKTGASLWAQGCMRYQLDTWRRQSGCNSPKLGTALYSSPWVVRFEGFTKRWSVRISNHHARVSSTIVVKSNRYRNHTTSELASSKQIKPFSSIAARRTCDCAEFDVGLATLLVLKLTQVTLHVYVHGADSDLVVPGSSNTYFIFSLLPYLCSRNIT